MFREALEVKNLEKVKRSKKTRKQTKGGKSLFNSKIVFFQKIDVGNILSTNRHYSNVLEKSHTF